MRVSETWSDTALLEFSKGHLQYEIKMFFGAGIELSRVVFPANDSTAVIFGNALVESFVTHLRNLLLFLNPYNRDENDVLSDDYFIDPVNGWMRNRPKETSALREARTRSHREISHLTIFRRDGKSESKKWPFEQLMQEIAQVLKVFVDNASDTKLDSTVKNLVDSIDLRISNRTVTDPSTKGIVSGPLSATNHVTDSKLVR
jgi:hypothetical protein